MRIFQLGGQQLEILRFLVAGGFCFLLEFILLYAFTEYAQLYYLYSAGLAFGISVVINYLLCRWWVFPGKKNNFKQFIGFVITSLIGLIINQLCMYIFVEIMLIYYMVAKAIAAGIVTVWNYIAKRKILK